MQGCQCPKDLNLSVDTQFFMSFPEGSLLQAKIIGFPGSSREADLSTVWAIVFITLDKYQVGLPVRWVEKDQNSSLNG